MVHKGPDPVHLIHGIRLIFILLVLESLKKGIELTLPGLDFFISDMGSMRHGLSKGFFGPFAFLVIPHLLFP